MWASAVMMMYLRTFYNTQGPIIRPPDSTYKVLTEDHDWLICRIRLCSAGLHQKPEPSPALFGQHWRPLI
uniref:Uncharacterized protein n=1 Tax=Anguilla anguilla TaxID=7936 RepID=A0A0E9TSC7_ANGAN